MPVLNIETRPLLSVRVPVESMQTALKIINTFDSEPVLRFTDSAFMLASKVGNNNIIAAEISIPFTDKIEKTFGGDVDFLVTKIKSLREMLKKSYKKGTMILIEYRKENLKITVDGEDKKTSLTLRNINKEDRKAFKWPKGVIDGSPGVVVYSGDIISSIGVSNEIAEFTKFTVTRDLMTVEAYSQWTKCENMDFSAEIQTADITGPEKFEPFSFFYSNSEISSIFSNKMNDLCSFWWYVKDGVMFIRSDVDGVEARYASARSTPAGTDTA